MTRWILNTLLVTVSVVIGQLVFCSTAAYAFARLEFRFKQPLFYMFLASMMVPGQVTLIPAFVLMRWLGLTDTEWALILPGLGSAFGIFLLRQFFLGLPREIEEAARVDGAGYLRIFWSIVLPMARPALATLAVFTFIGVWGDFLWPLIVLDSTDNMTLTVGLNYLNSAYSTDWARLMAGDVISLVPLMVVYAAVQRQFVQGIAMTGLKG